VRPVPEEGHYTHREVIILARIQLQPNDAVRKFARVAFPNYRGRTYYADITDREVSLSSHWDGGSRDYFALVKLEGENILRAQVPQTGTPFDGALSTPPKAAPTPILVIVEHSIFCGHDTGLTFYIHPALAPKMLPAPLDGDLSKAEELVLLAAATLKSSYQGRPLRRDTCARHGVSNSDYDNALGSLRAKGYLTKADAVTIDGRNRASSIKVRAFL